MPHRPDIDGLRAIAVSLVLAFHAFPRILSGGFVGVDVFFVVSGFLITGIIVRPDFSFTTFYYRRARRIIPALALVISLSLVVGGVVLTPNQFNVLGRQVAASALFVPNFLFWSETGYFDIASARKPLLHLWSLGVEEQFYIVWPPLILAATWLFRKRLPLVLLGLTILSFGYCISINSIAPDTAFYWPTSRAWELSAGGLLAVTSLPRLPRVADAAVCVGLAAIILTAVFLKAVPGLPGWPTVPAIAGTLLVICFGAESSLARATLAKAPMQWLGRISYPLYLWHWPVLVFAGIWKGASLSFLELIAANVFSLCGAALTHHFLEVPVKRVPVRNVAFGALVALVFVGSAGFSTRQLQSYLPSPYPTPLREALAYENYDFATDALASICWIAGSGTPGTSLPLCVKSGRDDVIAVWGDSHAGRLSPGLRNVFGPERITELAMDGCVPILSFEPLNCTKENAATLQALQEHPPRLLIMFGAWQNHEVDWDPASSYGQLLANTITQVKKAGITNILLVGPAPRFTPTLPIVLFRQWKIAKSADLPARLVVTIDATNVIDHHLSLIAAASDVQYLSLIKVLCDERGCLTKVPGTQSDLMTFDEAHLTTSGAEFVARAIQSATQSGRPN